MPVVSGTGYHHSLSEIRAMVYDLLMQDEATSHWTPDRVNTYINLILDSARLKKAVTTANLTMLSTVGLQTIIPPSAVWKVSRISYDDQRLTEISEAEMDLATGGDWDGLSGIPTAWYYDGTQFWFNKTCSEAGKAIVVYYWARPQELTADSSLVEFYKVMIPVIAYGTIMLAKAADEKFESAGFWEGKFNEHLALAVEHLQNPNESDSVTIIDQVGGWTD